MENMEALDGTVRTVQPQRCHFGKHNDYEGRFL